MLSRMIDDRPTRCIALLTVLAFLPGCYKWVAPSEPIQQAVASGDETVRVWTTSGEVLTLRHARVEQELLIGQDYARADTVPLSDVRRFEIEKHNTTGDLIILGSIAAVGALLVIVYNSIVPCC